ncbi:MAG: molybdate ABC transporter substrate-binding protein [Pseudomonadota bacterium]
MMIRAFLLIICLIGNAARAEVVVFAAASLKEPVDAIAASFEDVVVSYGGSGTMARQVSLGAPADVVLLANDDWMNVLIDDGYVRADTVIDFASNRLVMVGQAEAADVALEPESILMALDGGRIALGLTEAVPAGIYAKAALQSLGLWDAVAGQLAEVDNVRAALALVARGQAPLGIVYASDLRVTDQVRQVAVFPVESHPTIRYRGALTLDASPEAAAFLGFLTGEMGQRHLADAGFLPAAAAE